MSEGMFRPNSWQRPTSKGRVALAGIALEFMRVRRTPLKEILRRAVIPVKRNCACIKRAPHNICSDTEGGHTSLNDHSIFGGLSSEYALSMILLLPNSQREESKASAQKRARTAAQIQAAWGRRESSAHPAAANGSTGSAVTWRSLLLQAFVFHPLVPLCCIAL